MLVELFKQLAILVRNEACEFILDFVNDNTSNPTFTVQFEGTKTYVKNLNGFQIDVLQNDQSQDSWSPAA